MQPTTDVQKGHMVHTSGKTPLLSSQFSRPRCPGKRFDFSVFSEFCFFSLSPGLPWCLSGWTVQGVVLLRQRGGWRLLLPPRFYLGCFLGRLCVNFTLRCISWASMSKVCQEFHSKTQKHKVIGFASLCKAEVSLFSPMLIWWPFRFWPHIWTPECTTVDWCIYIL